MNDNCRCGMKSRAICKIERLFRLLEEKTAAQDLPPASPSSTTAALPVVIAGGTNLVVLVLCGPEKS